MAGEQALGTLPDGAALREREGRRITITFDPTRIRAPDLITFLLDSVTVTDLAVHESSIEDVVREMMGGAPRADTTSSGSMEETT